MPLNKTTLAAGIKALQDDLYADTGRTPEQARTHYANQLADLIDTFVKSATVTVPGSGLVAPGGGGSVTGTASTGTLT